jgi:CHAD domain-containing protein
VKSSKASPDGPTRAHVVALLRRQLAALRAAEPGTRLGSDPEELHKMRTAVRRLRAMLGALRDMFDPRWVAHLRKELDWLGDTLGARRDLDVLHQHLSAEVAPLRSGTRVAGRHLLERLDTQRGRARVHVVAALDSPRYRRLLARLTEGMRRPPVVTADLSLPAVAARAFKKLRKAVDALGDDLSDPELHAVRIRVKRARYAAEIAEPMRGRPARRFIKRAKKLQDALGEHQDAAVAEARLRGLLRAERRPLAVALSRKLVEKQQERRREARAKFLDGWPGLERRGRKAWRKA